MLRGDEPFGDSFCMSLSGTGGLLSATTLTSIQGGDCFRPRALTISASGDNVVDPICSVVMYKNNGGEEIN